VKQNRDEFSARVVQTLRRRVGDRCSKPGCRCPTSGPNEHPDLATNIGEAAHITSAAPGGPRYDATLTSEQRCSIANAIWLCKNHAREIDVDPMRYPARMLREWREDAERYARETLGVQMATEALEDIEGDEPPTSTVETTRTWRCPYCNTGVVDGARVCTGCQAELVYGLTNKEASEAFYMGVFFGGGGAVMLLFGGPSWINAKTGWQISPGFGLGVYALFPIVLSAFVAVRLFFRWRLATIEADSPRFTRHFNS
jgi:hypothetical protein